MFYFVCFGERGNEALDNSIAGPFSLCKSFFVKKIKKQMPSMGFQFGALSAFTRFLRPTAVYGTV